ncbi:MAG: alpha/beta hydrolase [Pseudomonadota bacterium]
MVRRDFLSRAAAAATAIPLFGCAGGDTDRAAAETAFPPVGRFIETRGVRLHYVDEGSGPPIVLIHGASGNLRDWTFSMTERLGDRFRVIAVDRPGHGYSERPATGGENPAVQAEIIADGVAVLGVEKTMIAGHSWGGAVAAAWALARPDQVAGAAFLAGATYPWGGDGGLLYRLGSGAFGGAVNSLARAYVRGDRAASVIRGVFEPNEMPTGYAEHLGVPLALRPDTFRWNAEDINQLDGHLRAQAPRYGELAMPLEVLHGDADDTVFVDIHSRPLAADAQNARLTILRGVGHMPHHIAEDEVVAAFDRLREQAFG